MVQISDALSIYLAVGDSVKHCYAVQFDETTDENDAKNILTEDNQVAWNPLIILTYRSYVTLARETAQADFEIMLDVKSGATAGEPEDLWCQTSIILGLATVLRFTCCSDALKCHLESHWTWVINIIHDHT